MNRLNVSETFYSLQGEGQTMGHPAVFLRLTGCNLNCVWCDTTEIWRKGAPILFKNVLSKAYVKRLQTGAHLVITGGEPLLHSNQIAGYLKWLVNKYQFSPIVEVETNGTIIPTLSLMDFVHYWNVSPKLKNSDEPFKKRFKVWPLRNFKCFSGSIFKFVISERGDYEEIIQEFDGIIDFDKIWLMPAGASQKELAVTRPIVAELCIETGHNYSDRLHVGIWNQKTGV